jgi:hypothetical protein
MILLQELDAISACATDHKKIPRTYLTMSKYDIKHIAKLDFEIKYRLSPSNSGYYQVELSNSVLLPS